MVWKKEYQSNRDARELANPELREKRVADAKKSYESRKEERKTYMREYYKANPSKFPKRSPEKQAIHNESRKKRYAENAEFREQVKKKAREWQAANPMHKKAQRLKKYGMTPQEKDAMLASQGGVCAICKKAPKHVNVFPAIDHCHTTGVVRGILCSHCNMGIGKFMDSPELLIAAANYLLSRGSYGAT